jgi:hypothetical protein
VTAVRENNLKPWRNNVSRLGYALVGCSLLAVAALWYPTCSMGGYHCFDGTAGMAMAVAQGGVALGLICTLFGNGEKRLVFGGLALLELAYCYLQGLVH